MLFHSLQKHARQRPDAPALLLSSRADPATGEDVLSWGQLLDRVNGTARRLAMETHLSARPCVAHVVNNTWHDIVLSLACQSVGILEAPIDCGGGSEYTSACRRQLRASIELDEFWIDEDDKRSIVETVGDSRPLDSSVSPDSIAPESDAIVLWTGGTTGESKGVVLSHQSLFQNAVAKLAAVPQSADELRLTLLSISHGYARTSDLGTWLLSGGRLAIARGLEGWEQFASLRPALINAVPSLAERLLDSGPDALRLIGCGGAPMDDESFRAWTDRGVTVIQGYGLTETGPVICSQTPTTSRPHRVGGFVGGWENRIEGSRLFVRGPSLMSRYLDNKDATDEVIDPDGWFDTGDLVRWDDDSNQLEILGRVGDRLNLSNGYSVDPVPIENRYASVDEVRTALVTCAPQARQVELWIEWHQGQRADLSSVTNTLARWQQPAALHEFSIPEELRDGWTNRKGTLRRRPLIDWLSEKKRRGGKVD